MNIESLENIISLVCTVAGLLYCVFKYTEAPKRGYRLLIVFFLANFLSEYYWTVYGLVMPDYPEISEFAAYLGWNVGYLVLLIAVLFTRQDGAKRFFHPIMLLPIALNVPQLVLYIRFGGVLNNIWEVGTTTAAAVFCLQDIAYYVKHRDKRGNFPVFSALVLVFIAVTYAMWTTSCFDWESEIKNPYIYLSTVKSLACVMFAYGAGRRWEERGAARRKRSTSELRFRVLAHTVISIVIMGICAVGFFAAHWIKNSLSEEHGLFKNEGQIVIALFIISAVLILLVVVLIYALTSRYRHTVESIKKMNEGKRTQLNFIVTIVVTLALMAFTVAYNNVLLYNASVVSVYEDGEEIAKTTATELENYLTVAATTLRLAADSVDIMALNNSSFEEMTQYIMDQTARQAEQFDENFTGIYAYINGEYMDGLGWEPPEGYDATERDWYKTVVAANGEVVIVSPYVDAQTHSVVITIGKSISDPGNANGPSRNVVCLDVIVNHIDEVTRAVDIAGKGYGMVVNEDGFIIAHRDSSLNGENVRDVYGQELLDSILKAKSGRLTAFIDDEEYTLFVAPVMDQWYSMIVVGRTELLEGTNMQLAVNIMVSFVIFCLITFFYYIGYKNERIYGKRVEEMNIQVVSALASAIDAKDVYTNGHSTRVAEYSRMIAARAGYSKAEQDEIYMMGLVHDVGKIGVPDEVINKPSKLTREEYELVKKHPVIGSNILETIKDRPKLAIGARWHHERYGGGGYPDGISGEMIPEEARIIAVADAYDAMTSTRSYREAMPQAKVRSEIEKGSGTQFDPRYAAIMLKMIDEDTDFAMRERTD